MQNDNFQLPDILIRTFNSADTLESCLSSIKKLVPHNNIIIADHNSTDRTLEIARSFGAEIHSEEVGLGFATNILIKSSRSEYVLFVDGDIEVIRNDFVSIALLELSEHSVGAVVGCGKNHDFLYGLPLGLTMFRRRDIIDARIPDVIQGRETYYLQECLRHKSLKVKYVRDAMIHRSTYRKYRYWPEWQGAQIRITPGRHLHQLVFAIPIIFMMHLNSRSVKNYLYSPVFYFKLLKGYVNPEKFKSFDRRNFSG